MIVNTDFFFLSHRLPIALAAKAQGMRVVIATSDTGRIGEIRAQGLEHFEIRMTRSHTGLVREATGLFDVWRVIRKVKPDVLHLVATKAVVYGGIVARFDRRMSVVFAVTGAGFVFGEKRHGVAPVVSFLLSKVLNRGRSRIIFQNADDRADFVERGLCSLDSTALIRGSGVDVDDWPVYPEPDTPVVMFASRLFEEKGIRTFVEAAKHIRADRADVRFVVVGDVDDGLPSSVPSEDLAAWELSGAIELWGYRTDMQFVLGQCTLFALPTYHREGVPRVLLEAGAAARACVSTSIPGCRDVIEHGVTGLLVPPRDVRALEGAILCLLDDAEFRQRAGHRGRMRIAERFSLAMVVRRTLHLYDELLGEET